MQRVTMLRLLLCLFGLLATAGATADQQAKDPIRVLLVDGDPGKEPGKGETYFLGTALGVAKKDFQVQKQESLDSGGEEFRRAEVVILCNVPEVSKQQSRALEEFLKEGGGVMIFLGDKVKPKEYNRKLYREGKGILPGKLTGVVALDNAALDFNRSTVPRLAELAEMPGGNTRKAYGLELRKSDAGRIICPFSTGQPAIAEKAVGRGKCVLFTTTCDRDWTNLPSRVVYVALIFETLRHAASQP